MAERVIRQIMDPFGQCAEFTRNFNPSLRQWQGLSAATGEFFWRLLRLCHDKRHLNGLFAGRRENVLKN